MRSGDQREANMAFCHECRTGEDDARNTIEFTTATSPQRTAMGRTSANPLGNIFGCCESQDRDVTEDLPTKHAVRGSSDAGEAGAIRIPAITTPSPKRESPTALTPVQQQMASPSAPSSPAKDKSPKKPPKGCFDYRHRLEEEEAMAKACWCWYCCCCGWACHRQPTPLELQVNCVCCQQLCQTQDVYATPGPCSVIHTCCFCTTLLQVPWKLGHPRCMCANEECCGVNGGLARAVEQRRKDDLTQGGGVDSFDSALYDSFIPCWCCCLGCAATPVFIALVNSFMKCSCVMCRFSSQLPDMEDEDCICCSYLLNCWWCLGQGRCPPDISATPILACCGWRLRQFRGAVAGHHHHELDSANEIQADFPLAEILSNEEIPYGTEFAPRP